jgi:hypothetical protein
VKFHMKSARSILTALVLITTLSVTCWAAEIPQAIVFENTNMEGQHKHFFASDPDLTKNSDGKFWNDQISSIVIISGNWTFYVDPVGEGSVSNPNISLSPGVYPDVSSVAIQDNSISQIRLENEVTENLIQSPTTNDIGTAKASIVVVKR